MGGYSATQIYQMFHSGPGTTGIYYATDGAATQMSTQDDINTQIGQLNAKMAAGWQGDAAQQAMAGATPLANASNDATNALAVHQDVMSQQAEAFTTARNSVTNVPSQMPTNLGNDFLAAIGDTGPLDDQINQYASQSQNNVQVYQNYAMMSSITADSMPQTYGQIPISNATITVVSPTSTSGGGGYSGSAMVGGGANGTEAEREAALRRLTAAPNAGGSGGANGEDELSSAGSGTIDAPPGSGGGFRLPGAPNEPNLNTNPDAFVPTVLEDEVPIGAIPTGGRNNNDDEGPTPGGGGFGPTNFSGDLSGSLNGPGGAPGGGSAQSAMESLHGGSGLGSGSGSGSGASDLTNSSRSGIGMASQATEESMMGGGSGFGPGGGAGAAGEEGGMGGGGMGGRRDEDEEHTTASFLQEADPDALFGTDEVTAPPVIGE
ncbi:MAG TPA: hypothetical protein VHZ97_29595 [Pseudonocardiaceae bacterium]|nr:hypothetical protein [Pseudonocardiaceae bacterium]